MNLHGRSFLTLKDYTKEELVSLIYEDMKKIFLNSGIKIK